MDKDLKKVASNAAVIEIEYDWGKNAYKKGDTVSIGNKEYTVVAEQFCMDEASGRVKAVALKDKDGNIYFHYRGTGDLEWDYNTAAYGKNPSQLQTEGLQWFEDTYKKLQEENAITGKVYITGHSQGANSAMYTMMNSEYAENVDMCVPLDGPQFSHALVDDMRRNLGEEAYERLRRKIYAVNGENDFVHILGQESVIPEDQVYYIKQQKSVDGDGNDNGIVGYHQADGMYNDNYEIEPNDSNRPSDFGKYLKLFTDKIKELPQEDQEKAAEVIMKIVENAEKSTVTITDAELKDLFKLLIPIVTDYLEEYPEGVGVMLEQALGLTPEASEALTELIKHINSYPEPLRKALLDGLAQGVYINDDGKIDFDKKKLPPSVLVALPIALETILTHPEDLWDVLEGLGVIDGLKDWIKENPLLTAGIAVAAIITAKIWAPVAAAVVAVIAIADVAIRIVQGIVELAENIKNFITDLFDSIKNTVKKIKEWFRNTFNKGAQYVKENPYFKADTDKLYSYANRLRSVNNRLRSLDSGLRSLYWQVGFLDLWDILCANIITSESWSLNCAINYLNGTAERLTSADNKARGYLEG